MKSLALFRRLSLFAVALLLSAGAALAAPSVITASVNGGGTQLVGSTGGVQLVLASQGTEAGVGFSVTFDPAVLRYDSFTNGSGLSGAALNVNSSQAATGKVGVALALSSGTFAAGSRQLVVLNFTVVSATSGNTAIAFSDTPVFREISDAAAETLTSTFTGATVTAVPTVRATQAIASVNLDAGFSAASVVPVVGSSGFPPYTYSISPALPPSPSLLTFDTATGALSGAPAVAAESTTYTVTVKDSTNATDSKTFGLRINSALTSTLAVASKAYQVGLPSGTFLPVTATGGTPPYTYAIAGSPTAQLPAGLSFNSITGEVNGVPTETWAAKNYTVTVIDAINASTPGKTFSLAVNAPIVVTQAIATKTLTVGRTATFTPVTASLGTPPYAFSVDASGPSFPVGLSLNAVTGEVTSTLQLVAAASKNYTLRVTDSLGLFETAGFSLVVNVAPSAATTVAAKTLSAGGPASFTPLTLTGGTPPYSYSVNNPLPSGLTFTSATGAIGGSPSAAQASTNYTITGTDANGATVQQTLALTINSALVTTQAVASRTLTAGVDVPYFPVTASGGTAPYVFSISGPPALPANLTIASATGSIGGAALAAAATNTYTVLVSDAAGATSSKTFSLTVNGPLVATQAIATRTLTAGSAATPFTPVMATGGTAPYAFAVTTPAAPTTPATLPAGLTFDPATGAFGGTPTAALAATTFTIRITDAAGASDSSKTFTLTINGPLTANLAIAAKSLSVGGNAGPFIPVAGGGGTAPYVYSVATPAAPTTPATLPAGLAFDPATGAFSGVPTVAQATTSYLVKVTDATTASQSQTFSLTVNAAVVATPAIAAKTLTAGRTATFTPVIASLGTPPYVFSDVSATALPGTMVLNSATGALNGTAPAAAAATYTLKATDSAGSSATASFNLAVNVAPSAATTVAAKTITAGGPVSFTPLTLTGGLPPYAYSINNALPSGLTFNTSTGAVGGSANAAQAVTNYVITGTDANGATFTQNLALTINSALATTQAIATRTLTSATVAAAFIPVTASGGTTPYLFSIDTTGTNPPLPADLNIDSATGAISGTPLAATATKTYTVLVTDAAGATSSKTFSLTVNGPLAATVAIANKVIDAQTTITPFTPITAAGGTTPYVFSIFPGSTPLQTNLVLNPATGEITGASTSVGIASYRIKITDAASASVDATFSLTINAPLLTVLDIPTTRLTANSAAAAFTPVLASNGTLPYLFSIDTSDGKPALPAGLNLNPSTGAITGSATTSAATANYTLKVTDAGDGVSSRVFALTVNPALTPVAGQTVASKALTAGGNATFTPLPVTGGTLPIAYSTTKPLPAGLTLDPSTGVISGSATTATASDVYNIIATDRVNATATQALTLVVNPPLVPTVAVASKILLVNTAVTPFTPITVTGGTAPITYSMVPDMVGFGFNSLTGAVGGMPTSTTNGAVTVTINISDAGGAFVQRTFLLKVNQLPAIAAQPTANATYLVGNALTLSVTGTGSPAPTYQWRKGGTDLPGKTASTLAFAALALTDAGSYDVVVTNESGSVTSTAVSFLVYQPPVITTQPANQTIVAGQGATFTVVANGDPAPTYQWRRNGLNLAGATTATLTLPGVSFDGGGTFTVVLTNAGGSITSNPATLTVNPAAPVLLGLSTTTGVIQKSFVSQVQTAATQATFSAVGLPAGLTLFPNTGQITGLGTTAGSFPVAFTATNVTGSDTKTFTITIKPEAPVINSAAAAAGRVGTAFSFAVLASGTPTGYAATGLPAGLSINPTTGVISGTPTAAGASAVTLSATNAGGTVTGSLQLVIEPALNAPTFAGNTNLIAVQGTAFAFTPVFGGAPFTANFTATGLPAGITLTSATIGSIGGTPTVTGTFSVVITATNAGGSLAVPFNLVVNPAAAAPVITSASNAVATVGTPFSFTLTSTGTPAASSYSATVLPSLGLSLNAATGVISGTPTGSGTLTLQVRGTNTVGTGPASVLVIAVSPASTASIITSAPVAPGRVGDAFTYTLAASNSPTGFVVTSGTLPAGLTLASGVVSGTPTQSGQTRVWFAADNAGGRGLALEVLFSIAPASTTPVIVSNGTATGQVGEAFQYAILATNSPTSHAATGLPDGLALDAATGVISGTPLAATTAPLSVTLTATKGTETSAAKILLLTIAPANNTPVITSPLAVSGRVGAALTYTATGTSSTTSFVATGLPDGLTLAPSTGIISGAPTRAGTFSATLRAINILGLGAPSTLVFRIAAAVSAPAITSAPTVAGKVGAASALSYQVTASPGPITAYALTGTLPLGLTFNSATGLLTGRPTAAGVSTVEITATNDSGTSVPQSLIINIAPADNVPVITSPTIAYGTVGTAFTYQITAAGTPAFPAAPFPAPFLLEAVNLPPGLAVNASTGVIQGQPLVVGTFTATLVGTNSAGTGLYRDLTIVIQPPATAPVITSPTVAIAEAGGATFNYQITATQNPTGFEVLGAPAWLSVNTTTGALTGLPFSIGTYPVQLIARNASGAGSPVTLTITVNAWSQAPVITSSRAASGKVLSPFVYQITVVRPEGQPQVPLTYGAAGLPSGLGIDPATGLISGIPVESGRFEVTLLVKFGGSDCQPVTLVLTVQSRLAF